MKDFKFYFGGFYFLLGIVVGTILLSLCSWGHINKENKPSVLKSDSIVVLDTLTTKEKTQKVKDSDKVSLNDKTLYKELKAKGIAHPKIVLAQAKLETGNYTSKVYLTHNNLFGLRKSNGSYYKFNHWTESVKAYKDYVQYKYQSSKDYYQFLKDIGYAEDKLYIEKIKEIVNQV